MDAVNSFFPWLLRASWQASVLRGVVLLVRWLFRQKLSPRWRYSLWLLLVLRLVLPATPKSAVTIFNLTTYARAPLSSRVVHESDDFTPPSASQIPASATSPSSLLQPAMDTSTPAFHPSSTDLGSQAAPSVGLGMWFSWLPAIWIAGVCLLSLRLVWQNTRFARRVLKQRQVTNSDALDVLEDCKQLMRLRTPLTVIETSEVHSPALYGFIRPRLVLPQGLLGEKTPITHPSGPTALMIKKLDLPEDASQPPWQSSRGSNRTEPKGESTEYWTLENYLPEEKRAAK